MKAGRELDALIAEKVMGWHKSSADYARLAWNTPTGIITWEESSYGRFQPSVHIQDSWLVVEKLDLHVWPMFDNGERAAWGCGIPWRTSIAKADTAPLAICLAALKAVEGK